jgi:hypothetical protein
VALGFIENPENKAEINHKDGVKSNNNVDNLEWNTRSENCSHAVRIGLKNNMPKGIQHPGAKLTMAKAHRMRTMAELGHTTSNIAKIFEVTTCTVRNIVLRKYWV